MIPFGKRPIKMPPTVLGQEEVHDLNTMCASPIPSIEAAVLLTLYAAGLRLAEATHLKLLRTSTRSGCS